MSYPIILLYNPLQSSTILWQLPRTKTIELAAEGCDETRERSDR